MKRTRRGALVALILVTVTLLGTGLALGDGSGAIYRGAQPTEFRSNLEWRTSDYGGGDSPEFILRRRTLIKVYARAGEQLLVGSSGVGVPGGSGDIRIFNPGRVVGTVGQETGDASFTNWPDFPAAVAPVDGVYADLGFSCLQQRIARNDGRGRIATRAADSAGPLPEPNGYQPCVYVAPTTGIYNVVFSGPPGVFTDQEPDISGSLDFPEARDLDGRQGGSVTFWDVTVRDATGATTFPGRAFTYYYTANTGANARPVAGRMFVVTSDGYIYQVDMTGDPFGFIFYANQLGFQNTDGTPLYRNLLADPSASFQDQNQLRELQGGVRLLPPAFPLFSSQPDPLVLESLGLPRGPVAPQISNFRFVGLNGQPVTGVSQGGTFSFNTTVPGIFTVVVSRDGTDFDPTNPLNRALRGVAAGDGQAPGGIVASVAWDGRDNQGQPFPEGEFTARTAIQGGEVHFPQIDFENNLEGGPQIPTPW